MIANESSDKQVVGEISVQINCSDGDGLTELEKLLKQKTFTWYPLNDVHDFMWHHSFWYGVCWSVCLVVCRNTIKSAHFAYHHERKRTLW